MPVDWSQLGCAYRCVPGAQKSIGTTGVSGPGLSSKVQRQWPVVVMDIESARQNGWSAHECLVSGLILADGFPRIPIEMDLISGGFEVGDT